MDYQNSYGQGRTESWRCPECDTINSTEICVVCSCPKPIREAGWRCPKCGATNLQSQKVCSYCTKPKKKRIRVLLVFALIVVAACLIVSAMTGATSGTPEKHGGEDTIDYPISEKNYDIFGGLKSNTLRHEDGSGCRWDYEDGKEVLYVSWDENGNESSRVESAYSSNGFLAQEISIYMGENGYERSRVESTYGSNGSLAQEIRIYMDENGNEDHRTESTYNPDGTLAKEVSCYVSTGSMYFTYYEDGEPYEKSYWADGYCHSVTEYVDGKESLTTYYDEKGEILRIKLIIRNSTGQIERVEFYDSEGYLTAKNIYKNEKPGEWEFFITDTVERLTIMASML